MPVHELSNADIRAISVVSKGANRRRFFLRKAEGEGEDTAIAIDSQRLVKADDWSAVYCVVAEPGALEGPGEGAANPEVDDRWSEDEIRKAAHGFMRNGGLINKMHAALDPYGQLVENAIALADFTIDGEKIKKGSWYIAFEPTAEGKAAIEKGEFTGISIEGTATRVLVEKGEDDHGALDALLLATGASPGESAELLKVADLPGFEGSELEALEKAVGAALPGLDRSPKKNWVEQAGGLPDLIDRAARHLHYERGRPIGAAIATAVNWAKKGCSTGRAFGGKVKVSSAAQARMCAAAASWEAKKAKAHVTKAHVAKGEIAWETEDGVAELLKVQFQETLHPRNRGRFKSKGQIAAEQKRTATASARYTQAANTLSSLGFYKGKNNGVLTPALRQAISRFQKERGLPVTGAPDPTTMAKLRRGRAVQSGGAVVPKSFANRPNPVATSVKDWNALPAKRKLNLMRGFKRDGGKLPPYRTFGKDGSIIPAKAGTAARATPKGAETRVPNPARVNPAKWNRVGDKERARLMEHFLKRGGKLPKDRKFLEDGSLVTAADHPTFFRGGKSSGSTRKRRSVKKQMPDSLLHRVAKAVGLSEDEIEEAATPEEDITKTVTFGELMAQRELDDELPQAFSALRDSVWRAFNPAPNDDSGRDPAEVIGTSMDEFKEWVVDLLTRVPVSKIEEQIAGTDTDFSGSTEDAPTVSDMSWTDEEKDRIEKLEGAVDELPEKVAEQVAKAAKGENDTPTAESVQKSLDELKDTFGSKLESVSSDLKKLGSGGSTLRDEHEEPVKKSGSKAHEGIL